VSRSRMHSSVDSCWSFAVEVEVIDPSYLGLLKSKT
jgi:hypothetical protein